MTKTTHTVRTFSTYEEARSAVEKLLDHDIPTAAVSISARGIRLVEKLHPRGWASAAGDGALSGALIGLLVGFFLGLLNLSAPGFSALVLGFWGAVIGSIAGMVTTLVAHAFRRGSERHTTERSLRADRFEVCVMDDHVERARRILAGGEAEPVSSAA